jgi:uncharacterized protein (TIGR02266 family)
MEASRGASMSKKTRGRTKSSSKGNAKQQPAQKGAKPAQKPTTAPGSTAGTRKDPRAPLDLLVQVRTSSLEEFRAIHAVNLSAGGMFLRTDDVRPVGSEIYFQLVLETGGPLLEGFGRVVHASAPDAKERGMGVEFVSVLEPSRSIIQALVAERLRGQPSSSSVTAAPASVSSSAGSDLGRGGQSSSVTG